MDADVFSILDELRRVSLESLRGYSRAASEVGSPELRAALEEVAVVCRHAAHRLAGYLDSVSIPTRDQALSKELEFRGWIDLGANLQGRSVKAILEECERGEQFAVGRYLEALDVQLPANARPTLQGQLDARRRAYKAIVNFQQQKARIAVDSL